MNNIDVLKLANQAGLCIDANNSGVDDLYAFAVLILAEGREQAQPVAWLHPANPTCVTTDPTAYARGIPLYTAPPQTALTDWQVHRAMLAIDNASHGDIEVTFDEMKTALDAAHEIKEKAQ